MAADDRQDPESIALVEGCLLQVNEQEEAEARMAEFSRLRDELSQTTGGLEQNVDGSGVQIAALPAGVPKLPPQLRVTAEITELKRVLLSTAAADMKLPRVGFFGMVSQRFALFLSLTAFHCSFSAFRCLKTIV